jgi:hypothetical protein
MMLLDNVAAPRGNSTSPNSSLEEEERAFMERRTLAGRRDDTERGDDHVLAREAFEGTVLEVTDEEVLVQYDTGDDLVEQCYRKDQFLPGKVPAAGDRIAVDVVVKALGPLRECASTGRCDEYRRKNVVSGDLRF